MDKKNHDIEVLRTIAIVFVFLAHIPSLLAPTSFYWKIFAYSRFGSGVDLFFCISGYIVTKSLLGKKLHLMDKKSFFKEAKLFYIKRLWRLLPASLFWIIVSLILAILMKETHAFISFKKLLTSAFFSATQTQNFYFIFCRDNGSCGNLGIYWSLSLENQFYFILPILLFVFNNKKLCLLMVFVFFLQFFIPRTLNNHTPVGWPIRTDAIALGVIIAILRTKESFSKLDFRFFSSAFLSAVTLTALCFALAIFTKPEPVVFFQVGITALVSGILVLIASQNKNYFSRSKIVLKLCDYIGSRSYSFYLTHVIALAMTRGIFMNNSPDYSDMGTITRLLFFFTLTLILTEFSYKHIENKYRYHWKKDS